MGGSINNKTKFRQIIDSPDRVDHVKNMFAKIAPRYDLLNRIMSLGRDLSWRRIAVRRAGFTTGSFVIDLGVGSGDMAREVLTQVKDSTIVGYDNCPELMEIGKNKISSQQLIWVVGDGRSFPFQANCFQGLVAAFSIRNMPQRDQVFAEIYRVLKPGGKVVILDMVRPRNTLFKFIFRFQFKYIVPVLGRLLGSDPDAYSYLLPSIENFYTAIELADKLKSIGCTEVYSKDLMFKTVSLAIGIK